MTGVWASLLWLYKYFFFFIFKFLELTLRERVFCKTSKRNCSCSSEAVSAGWDGSARNPCCWLLDSRYCSNSLVSCCKLATVSVSVLLPSSTRSPGGGDTYTQTQSVFLMFKNNQQRTFLHIWRTGCVHVEIMRGMTVKQGTKKPQQKTLCFHKVVQMLKQLRGCQHY